MISLVDLKHDRTLIVAASTVLLLATYLLYDDSWMSQLTSAIGPSIGKIQEQKNDARHRSNDSLVWYKAREAQKINLGDAVFSGKQSYVQIELRNGDGLTVGENSMVIFNESQNQKLANLESGNFRLKIEGVLKFAIRGEVTTVKGDHAQIQVLIDGANQGRLKLLRGKAQLLTDGQRPVPLTESFFDLDKMARLAKTATTLPNFIAPENQILKVSYKWRLNDLYSATDNGLMRIDPPAAVDANATLTWSSSTRPAKAFIEISQKSDFNIVTKMISNSGGVTISPLFVGPNFWRVSDDKKSWSDPQKIIVEANFLTDEIPQVSKDEIKIPLLENSVAHEVRVLPRFGIKGYVTETSVTPEFRADKSHAAWAPSPQPKIVFFDPGKYFYRIRAVNEKQELSEWSAVIALEVFRPRPAPAPRLVKAKATGFVHDELTATFKSQFPVEIEIATEQGMILDTFKSLSASWIAPFAGTFSLRAFALNEYKQRGPSSSPIVLTVTEKLIPRLAIKPEAVPREPATVNATSTSVAIGLPSSRANDKYKNSVVVIEGFLSKIQSSQQFYQNQSAPAMAGLGVRGMTWWDHAGAEGKIKAGVLGVNAAGSGMAPKDIEGRFHYRFISPSFSKLIREVQISIFAGYEFYANSSSALSSQYQLFTLGTSFDFPLADRWAAGGEISGGYGFDGSQKSEAAAHIDYFFGPEWSFGLGYRIHLFQAGSSLTAPGGYLPYREGYLEEYTLLQHHF